MADARTAATPPPGLDDPFLVPATMRQPSDTIGPRAARTIARIITATREVFEARGYAGTTIDEITRVANVSRASFYTYFPSKREVLLAVGADAASASEALIDRLPGLAGSIEGLTTWADAYLDLLDVHGAFAFAWTQAAHEDDDIRVAGMRRHYELCRRLGEALFASAGRTDGDPGPAGLVLMAMFERAWSYAGLYTESVTRQALVEQSALAMWGLARRPAG